MNKSDDNDNSTRMVKKTAKYVALSVGALVLVAAGFSSFYTVQPTEMAGLRMFGKVESVQPVGPGLHFKVPFLESVDTLQTSQSTYNMQDMQVYTIDNQPVEIGINVIYQIPKSSVLHLLYDVGRAGNVDIDGTILPVVRDRALATFAQYNTLTISAQRAQIAMSMQKDIAKGLWDKFGIRVLGVQLVNIRYSNTFVTSVNAAVRAKAQAVQAQNTVLQKQYEGQQAIVTAKAQADAAIEKANGDAKAILIRAQANAKAIQIMGEALQSNPNYLKYEQIKQWNGILPKYMLGNGIPLINLNQDKK